MNLPRGWESVPFAECCIRVADNRKPSECKGRPYLGLEHLRAGFPALLGVGNGSDIASAKTAFHTGDVLFGKLRPYLRKGLRAPFDGVCSTDVLVFRAKNGARSEYLGYLIHTDPFVEQAIRTTSGLNHPRTSWDGLRGFLVSLPPLDEQRQIAVVLAAVQRAIERQERLIALTTELQKALMSKLFTEGTRGEPLKQTEIGPLPQSWRVVSIRQECSECAFGPRFSSKEYGPDGAITTLRTTDLDDDGQIDYTHAPRANLDRTRFASHFLRPGDIVVSRSGTCGIASVFEGYERPVLPGAFLIRLRMRDSVWPQYLRHYLNSAQGRARTAVIAEGAIQKNISGTRLQDLLIPLPARGDQLAIASGIDMVARIGAVNRHRKGVLEALFRALLQRLTTAQIRVHDLDLAGLEEGEPEPAGAV